MSSAVRAIALKDIRAIRGNIQVWMPMLIVPIMLGVLVPGGLVLAVLHFGGDPKLGDLTQILERIPSGSLADLLATLHTPATKAAFFFANYLLAPFFLIIPLMAASTISADSFAGEKERGTLENLLFSPASIADVFLGKALAAFLPALGLTWATFLLTAITVNAAGWSAFNRLFFPTVNWLPLLLLVIPLLALAIIFLTVFISAKVRTFQAAYQLGGIVVLPVIGLIVGQISGVLLLSVQAIVWIGVGLAVIDVALLLLLRSFLDRPRLFESQVG